MEVRPEGCCGREKEGHSIWGEDSENEDGQDERDSDLIIKRGETAALNLVEVSSHIFNRSNDGIASLYSRLTPPLLTAPTHRYAPIPSLLYESKHAFSRSQNCTLPQYLARWQAPLGFIMPARAAFYSHVECLDGENSQCFLARCLLPRLIPNRHTPLGTPLLGNESATSAMPSAGFGQRLRQRKPNTSRNAVSNLP